MNRNELFIYVEEKDVEDIVERISGTVASSDLEDSSVKFNGALRRLLG